MNNRIVIALISCVLVSVIGGFGAPLFCKSSTDASCGERWQNASNGALAASSTLSALLVRLTRPDSSDSLP